MAVGILIALAGVILIGRTLKSDLVDRLVGPITGGTDDADGVKVRPGVGDFTADGRPKPGAVGGGGDFGSVGDFLPNGQARPGAVGGGGDFTAQQLRAGR